MVESDRTEANKVRGCASQVWLATTVEPGQAGEPTRLAFTGDSDAHIVKGLIAILLSIHSGKTAAEIAATDALAVFAGLGLKDHLSQQRSNGLASMAQRIKRDAAAALG